ncbi:hypothetical protein ABIF69_004411 [Bradyrhizobium japonicum]
MKIDGLHPIRWPDEHKKRPAILALAHFARTEMAHGHAGAGDEFREDVHKELAKGFARGPEGMLLADPLFFTSVLKAECVSALKAVHGCGRERRRGAASDGGGAGRRSFGSEGFRPLLPDALPLHGVRG